MKLINHIRSCLAALEPRNISSGFTREAAVLMPIFKSKDEYCMLLTLRTLEVETHKGQISFPGGMREGNEDLLKTALRETYEEVGIEEAKIEPLGKFHDYISITGYRVTPFVGYIETPFKTVPQIREVAEVLQVPIKTFLDPSLLRIEKKAYLDREDVYYYSFGTHQIWGLTARILKDFFDTLQLQTEITNDELKHAPSNACK
jgi:8-oxo-dGTP pyrophosphatase MutT (NUDIX family)